jgi:hypothetical protein
MLADGGSAANRCEPDFGTSPTRLSQQAIPVTGAQEEKVHVSSWPILLQKSVGSTLSAKAEI